MALEDVNTKGSPGWWFKRLGRQQADRRPELDKLWNRYISKPPESPWAANAKAQEAFRAFVRLTRTNYEELIARAVLDRQTPVGFRTAAAGDEGGDAAAAELWRSNFMAVQASEILESKLVLREGYAIVGPPDADSEGQAIITAEDPREVITAQDPIRPWITRAALKTYFDPDEELEVAYVYLPGASRGGQAEVHRATRKARSRSINPGQPVNARAFTWDENVVRLPTSLCPVVRFPNRGGFAEFEKHQDLIDRIRYNVLQKLVIITMQAFRQRALKNMLTHYPDDWPVKEQRGKPIDLSEVASIFTSDPASIWLLPPMAELWESNPPDLTTVLNESKDAVRELATVSQSPFYMFMPDGANQSAEGAVVQREGINFKVEDHNTRDGLPFAQVMALGFAMMGTEHRDRAKLSAIETLWRPVERHSLAAKADASQKAKDSLSERRILTDIWQLTPAEADEEIRRREADAFAAMARQAIAGPPAGQPEERQPPQRVRSERVDQRQGEGEPARTG